MAVIGCTFGIQLKRILPTIQAALNKAKVVILLIGKRELEVGNTGENSLVLIDNSSHCIRIKINYKIELHFI